MGSSFSPPSSCTASMTGWYDSGGIDILGPAVRNGPCFLPGGIASAIRGTACPPGYGSVTRSSSSTLCCPEIPWAKDGKGFTFAVTDAQSGLACRTTLDGAVLKWPETTLDGVGNVKSSSTLTFDGKPDQRALNGHGIWLVSQTQTSTASSTSTRLSISFSVSISDETPPPTATPDAVQTEQAQTGGGNSSGQLSAGAIAGVTIGVILGFILGLCIVRAGFIIWKRKRNAQEPLGSEKGPSPELEAALTTNPLLLHQAPVSHKTLKEPWQANMRQAPGTRYELDNTGVQRPVSEIGPGR